MLSGRLIGLSREIGVFIREIFIIDMDKKYFDLTNPNHNIDTLSIQMTDEYNCCIIDKNQNLFYGFILAKSQKENVFTICNFQKSSIDKKYQVRLVFRKTDSHFKDRNVYKGSDCVRVSFEKGQDGYREFWKMISFLYKWRETIDLGEFEDFFSITNKNTYDILNYVSDKDNKEIILSNLEKLSSDKLESIENLINITHIKQILDIWEKNKQNKQESFWQNLFTNNSLILSQIFSCPFIFLQQQFFCGGKNGKNQGGIEADFIYKNKLTQNTAFIEIKTPLTQIVNQTLYLGVNDEDDNAIYPISAALTGGVNEVLNQKNIFIQKKDSISSSEKEHFNFKCVLIGGTLSALSPGQIKSFELYRSSLRDVEIITFDELFARIELMLDILV
jgi:hypothetical protein